MTPEQPARDAPDFVPLEAGVALVDGCGTVILCRRPEVFGSTLPAEATPGLDFFRDLAPGTNVPAFRGRFLDAVRGGGGDIVFPYVFAGEGASLRADVGFRSDPAPDRYWIVADPRERIAGARRSATATAAIDARVRAEPVDPRICEREPIHVPGLIQANNVLVASGPDLVVTLCSANSAEALAVGPDALIGQPLAALLPAGFVVDLRDALAHGAVQPDAPLRRQVGLGTPPVPTLVTAHRHRGRVLIEFERVAADPRDFGAVGAVGIEEAMARLRGPADLTGLAGVAARELRALTGFERVLVYRFDREWNGEALGEDRSPDWPHSLLGLRFPASDIPAQARALYTRSRSRFVVDRDAVTVPLVADPASGNEPLDLTFAASRALSPIHLEYQRNLGVNGSMSASILVDGQLWGLVIGHHRRPHYLAPETRAAVTIVTDALSSRIHAIEATALMQARATDLDAQVRLIAQMAGADDFVEALMRGNATLLSLFGASGAAVVSGSRTSTLGRTPAAADLLALADWLRGRDTDGAQGLATDHLLGLYPPAARYRAVASGLIAARVEAGGDLLLWFRPEVTGTIVWGGDPRKSVIATTDNAVLPRRSFERWVEQRAGYAAPWSPWQVGIAEALAGAVAGVARRQSWRIAELTAKQDDLVAVLADKERLLAQKDLLTREIDHRVRNSLQIVASLLQAQRRTVTDPDARRAFSDTYARVMSVARVHDSLYQSESVEEVDLGQTIERLCNDLADMAGERRDVDLDAHPGLMVPYKTAMGLSLVATELVTNALKYAYPAEEPGQVRVKVAPQLDGVGICLTVADQGRGLPSDWATARPGHGLGMRLIRAMLEQIGGTLTVESEDPQGSRFVVCT